MENLIHELNGKRYVLLEVPFTTGNNSEMESRIKKYEGITQGVKEVDKKYRYVIGNVLIPESNIEAFNAEGYKRKSADEFDLGLPLPPHVSMVLNVFVVLLMLVVIGAIISRFW